MKKKRIIVRDKYQITIPEEIRSELSWIKPNEILNVYSENGKLVIEPDAKKAENKSWEEFMTNLPLIREALAPYGNGEDSTKLINEDRESR